MAAPIPPSEQYVYDLYYFNNRDFDFRALENILAIEALKEEYIYPSDEEAEYREVYEDEDDSNDEDNWRNDYPDEDPRYYDPDDEWEYEGIYCMWNPRIKTTQFELNPKWS